MSFSRIRWFHALRRLLDENCVVLNAFGRHLPFELAIGANGMVWLNAASAQRIVVISQGILSSERMTDAQTVRMVGELLHSLGDDSEVDDRLDESLSVAASTSTSRTPAAATDKSARGGSRSKPAAASARSARTRDEDMAVDDRDDGLDES